MKPYECCGLRFQHLYLFNRHRRAYHTVLRELADGGSVECEEYVVKLIDNYVHVIKRKG